MFGISNELWSVIGDPASGYVNAEGQVTVDGFNRFVSDQAKISGNSLLMLSDGSYGITKGVALYTGYTNGIYNGNIANDFAARSGDSIVTLDKTRLGDFIISASNAEYPVGVVFDEDFFSNVNFNEAFDTSSKALVENNSGRLFVFASSCCDPRHSSS